MGMSVTEFQERFTYSQILELIAYESMKMDDALLDVESEAGTMARARKAHREGWFNKD